MATKPQQESVQCAECGQYIDPFRGFVCKSCKRRPLCQEHRDPKMRGMCLKCANRLRRKQLQDLKSGVKSMKTFLRFIQFLFLVFAVVFVFQRFMPESIPSYIAENVVFKYIFIPGILSAVGFVVVYFIYLGQKKTVGELEAEISVPTSFAPRVR
jgi:hypothetical protein